MNHGEIVSFVWGIADLIRDTFRRGHYQDVILPVTVLRRLDCVLANTKERVLARQAELQGRGLQDLQAQLRRAAGFAFYNTSRYDFEKLLADAPHLAANLRNYIAGFSQNMREVIERFDFDNTISKLDEAGLLFQVLERFRNVNLHPDRVDNPTMGIIFEELIRRFNEALNENPGEHFTPRDVVHLMVDLMFRRRRRQNPASRRGLNGLRPLLRLRRHADDREGAHHRRAAEERRCSQAADQSECRNPPFRPGGEPGDLGSLEIGFLYERADRPRCG
jgi:type I restriction-modification system DNA methylase subunit